MRSTPAARQRRRRSAWGCHDQSSRPARVRQRLGGWCGGSIGQIEALAGINVQSHAERAALWNEFSHLFGGDTQALIDAVMDHCAAITLARIAQGELSLLRPGRAP